jgi:hypothetical protein
MDGWMDEARYCMPRRTAAQAAAWREAFITSTSRLALPIRELRLVETGAQVPTRMESAAMYGSGQYPCARAGLWAAGGAGMHAGS